MAGPTLKSPQWLLVAAFLSGTTGVLYETLYPHVLTTLIGGSVYVISATLITFLFAIGVGSLLAAWCVRWLWITEALLGVIALVIGGFFIFDVTALLPLGAHIPYHPVARVAAACLLMSPPALLVGISVPAFSLLLERQTHYRDEQLSLVYSLYNLGAMASILLSEYVLIRQFGIGQALMVFGSLDLVVALIARDASIAWKANRQSSNGSVDDGTYSMPDTTLAPRIFWRSPIVWALAVMGLVSGAFQMEAINLTNLSFGPTSDVLSAVVALALGGIGMGSLFVRYKGLSLRVIAIGMAAAIALPVYLWPGALGSSLDSLSAIHSFNGPGKLVFMAMFLGPFFVLAGASVPAAARALWSYRGGPGSRHGDYGRLLMVAAFGNAAGFIAFLALITWGITDDQLIIGMTALLWLTSFFAQARHRRECVTAQRSFHGKEVLLTALIALYLCLTATLQIAHRRELPTRIYATMHQEQVLHATLFSRMGARAAVYKKRRTNAFVVNGYESMRAWPRTLGPSDAMMNAAVPAFFTPGHDRALVIGAATGITAAVDARLYRHTWLFDIDPNTPALLRHFKRINDDVLSAPKLTFIANDALAWLARSDLTFDVISVTPTSPANRGTETVYSREFMSLAKSKLSPGGVFTLWIGTVDGARGMEVLWRTFRSVFPYTQWYRIRDGYIGMMGSAQPLRFHHRTPFNRLTATQQDLVARFARRLSGDGQRLPTANPLAWLVSSVLIDPKPAALDGIPLAPGIINTLNSPVLQSMARVSWQPVMGTTAAQVARARQWLTDHGA